MITKERRQGRTDHLGDELELVLGLLDKLLDLAAATALLDGRRRGGEALKRVDGLDLLDRAGVRRERSSLRSGYYYSSQFLYFHKLY